MIMPDDDHADDDHADDDHDHDLDPHTWMDPVRMADAARLIGAALHEIDPAGGWVAEGERVAAEMLAVHDEVTGILAVIPEERRKLVTNHDSLGYLADRYGFAIVGVAIPGGSTLASPSSAQIASLVTAIRQAQVTVLFAETTNPSSLLEAIAGEIDGVQVVEILSGSLAAPGEPGDTLAGMLVHNAEIIASALGSE
jgi:zinc/manganese transport system substrate-binding protein